MQKAINDESSGSVTLAALIEKERGKLMEAEAVLECLAVALDDCLQEMEPAVPYFNSVIDVVVRIIREAVDEMDSVHVKRLIGQLHGGQPDDQV